MQQNKRLGRILIYAGIAAAILTFVLLRSWVSGIEARERVQTVRVITVKQQIPARTVLDTVIPTPDALEFKEIPLKYVPDTAIVNNDAETTADLMQQLGSHITLIALQPGDILQANQLDSQGGLKPEMRAVSVAVDQVTSVGGTVRPGHRVDVFVSYEEELTENKKLPKTMLLLQDVEVLAVFGNVRYFYVPDPVSGEAATYANRSYVGAEESRYTAEGEMMKDTTVTLALSIDDAMKLTYMANFAKEVRLVIRRYDDTAVQSQQPVTAASFK